MSLGTVSLLFQDGQDGSVIAGPAQGMFVQYFRSDAAQPAPVVYIIDAVLPGLWRARRPGAAGHV